MLHQADSRSMPELAAGSVALVVTSPPYWQIKDYGDPGQIGFGQSLHAYLRDLDRVWRECHRVTAAGGRLCVNIGDQFARASLHGRYRVIPLHAEIICQCVAAGWDYMGSIVWRKKTTMNTSGGATVMGSYPYPPNGIVEIDFEYILLFKKPGTRPAVDPSLKREAAIDKEDWKTWFSGHWDVGGARKRGHEAPFPEEIPLRLIRMFSFPGDTVLDPFLGTGTTAMAAVHLGRDAVGYEINADYLRAAREALRARGGADVSSVHVRGGARSGGGGAQSRGGGSAARRDASRPAARGGDGGWAPRAPEMEPVVEGPRARPTPTLFTVRGVDDDCTLVLDSGARVVLGGLRITDAPRALAYLRARVLRKKVMLRDERAAARGLIVARVLLKNRININAQLIRAAAAVAGEVT
ncbi:MAG TPA: site-specific DNA-methyltransferase [Spirochaetia bacterium]